jgi:TPR repeat protein
MQSAGQIFLHKGDQTYGPFSLGEIETHLETGSFTESDQAWNEEKNEWVALAELPAFQSYCKVTRPLAAPPIPPPPPPLTTRKRTSKTVLFVGIIALAMACMSGYFFVAKENQLKPSFGGQPVSDQAVSASQPGPPVLVSAPNPSDALLSDANKGNVEAQWRLGKLYANGTGVAKDYSKALLWFQKAAAQGDSRAQNSLGVMYQYGKGVPTDFAQALSWYTKSAAQNDAKAEDNIGLLYYKGSGVKQDMAQAIQWFNKAADQNNPDAQFNLGFVYQKGTGVPVNLAKAVVMYKKASDQGDGAAENNLAEMYSRGTGVTQDYNQAFALFKAASEKENPAAEANLGGMYYKGQGVTQDYAQALQWFKKAADQGEASAQTKLGQMLENGEGTNKDTQAAIGWLTKAAEQGSRVAQNDLRKLLAPTEITDRLPLELSQGGHYVLKGVLLQQTQDDFMVGDLLPQTAFQTLSRVVGIPFGGFDGVLQSLENANIYQPNQQRMVIVPGNPDVYRAMNIPANTLMSIEGTFQGYKSLPMVSGEDVRLPIILASKIQMFGNPSRLISFETLDQQFADIDVMLSEGDVTSAINNLNSIIATSPSDGRVETYRAKVTKVQFGGIVSTFNTNISSGNYAEASKLFDKAKGLLPNDPSISLMVKGLLDLAGKRLDLAEAALKSSALYDADGMVTEVSSATSADDSFTSIRSRSDKIVSEIIAAAKQPLLEIVKPPKDFYGKVLCANLVQRFKVRMQSVAENGDINVRVEDFQYPQLFRSFVCTIVPSDQHPHTQFLLKFTGSKSDGVISASREVDMVYGKTAATAGAIVGGGYSVPTYREYGSSGLPVEGPKNGRLDLFNGLYYSVNDTASKFYCSLDGNGDLPGERISYMDTLNSYPLMLSLRDINPTDRTTTSITNGTCIGVRCLRTFGSLPAGFLVTWRHSNSPLTEALSQGNVSGATILTGFNGADLTGLSLDQFADIVRKTPVGTQVKIDFCNDSGNTYSCTLALIDIHDLIDHDEGMGDSRAVVQLKGAL